MATEPLIGEITMFAGNFAIRSWAFCDGQLLSIAENTALFSLLGTTYGGNGTTTFGLPDLRGRVPLHQGNGPGLSSRTIGEQAGQESVTLITGQMPQHTHGATCYTGNGTTANSVGNVWAAQPALLAYHPTPGGNNLHSSIIGNAGGSQSHENLIPFQAVNYLISLFGVYPSRN